MEGRVTAEARRQAAALAALYAILGISAAWWALALWPVPGAAPAWVERTRLACFGAEPGGLPNAGGWLVMVGQPLGMLLVLFAAWGRDLRGALARMLRSASGQLTAGVTLAAILAGAAGVAMRVSEADARSFAANTTESLAGALTPVNDSVPTMRLADQTGRIVGLDGLRGRPVLVTFAYAHCTTVCPLVVMDLLDVQRRLRVAGADSTVVPRVVVVTLDPLRDTPSRLSSIATQWKLDRDGHVLSGPVMDVERVLNAWRVPRVRNESTGDITHPTMVYVIDRNGRIRYVTPSDPDLIAGAVQAL